MKTFAVGDVHGQYSALKKLIAKLPIDFEKDELVFLGDLIDRGPQSKEVIEYVTKLQKQFYKVRVLKGNHEEMLLESFYREEDFSLWISNGGDATYFSFLERINISWQVFNNFFPVEIFEYLQSRPIRYENDHAIFVHAGACRDKDDKWKADSPQVALWYRGKDFFTKYKGKTMVVGHTPTNKIRIMLGEALMPINEMTAWSRNNIIAIDCGAGHDGRLCAVELPSGDLYYQKVENQEPNIS